MTEKWLNKKAKESNSDQGDIQDQLEEAIEHLREAYDSLRSAQSLMKGAADFNPGYNIEGNMDAYVINYIDGAPNSLIEKVEKYLEEVNDEDNWGQEEEYEEEGNAKQRAREEQGPPTGMPQ